jgi:hypothetical protein
MQLRSALCHAFVASRKCRRAFNRRRLGAAIHLRHYTVPAATGLVLTSIFRSKTLKLFNRFTAFGLSGSLGEPLNRCDRWGVLPFYFVAALGKAAREERLLVWARPSSPRR